MNTIVFIGRVLGRFSCILINMHGYFSFCQIFRLQPTPTHPAEMERDVDSQPTVRSVCIYTEHFSLFPSDIHVLG